MNRRRKVVRWGAMRFLLEAYRRQRRKLVVQRWLLLALRCLLIVLIALALGRPIAGSLGGAGEWGGRKSRLVYVVIDNSLTAGVRDRMREGGGEAGAALDRLKAGALAFVASLRETGTGGAGGVRDRAAGTGEASVLVGLVALGGPASAVVLPTTTDLGSIERQIEALTTTESRADWRGAMAAISRDIAESRAGGKVSSAPAVVSIFSEFREGSLSADELEAEGLNAGQSLNNAGTSRGKAAEEAAGMLPMGTVLIASKPAQEEVGNVSIVGIEPTRSVMVGSTAGEVGEQSRISLRRSGKNVSNAGETHVEAQLMVLSIAGQALRGPVATGVVNWNAGQQSGQATLNLPPIPMAIGESGGESVELTGTRANARSRHGVIVARIDGDELSGDNTAFCPVQVRPKLRVAIVATRKSLWSGDGSSMTNLGADDWVRLALTSVDVQPTVGFEGEANQIEVVHVDPTAVEAARLSGLDAVFVLRPDLLSEAAWGRLRLMCDAGGVVIVTPPGEAGAGSNAEQRGVESREGDGGAVQTWGDALTKAFDLEWTLDRQARSVATNGVGAKLAVSEKIRRSRPRTDPAAVGESQESMVGGVLDVLEGELPELLSGVSVLKVLEMRAIGVDRDSIGSGVQLELGDGTPMLWVGKPGVRKDQQVGGRDRGVLMYLACGLDLEWTDLPAKPLMVPMVQELARQGVALSRRQPRLVAGIRMEAEGAGLPTGSVELRRVDDVFEDSRSDSRSSRAHGAGEGAMPGENDRLVVDARTSSLREPIRSVGVWHAIDDRGAMIGVVAVNADSSAGRVGTQDRAAVSVGLGKLIGWNALEAGGAGSVDNTDVSDKAERESGDLNVAEPGREVVWLDLDGAEGMAQTRRALESILGAKDQDDRWSLRLMMLALVVAIGEMFLARSASHAVREDARPILAVLGLGSMLKKSKEVA